MRPSMRCVGCGLWLMARGAFTSPRQQIRRASRISSPSRQHEIVRRSPVFSGSQYSHAHAGQSSRHGPTTRSLQCVCPRHARLRRRLSRCNIASAAGPRGAQPTLTQWSAWLGGSHSRSRKSKGRGQGRDDAENVPFRSCRAPHGQGAAGTGFQGTCSHQAGQAAVTGRPDRGRPTSFSGAGNAPQGRSECTLFPGPTCVQDAVTANGGCEHQNQGCCPILAASAP